MVTSPLTAATLLLASLACSPALHTGAQAAASNRAPLLPVTPGASPEAAKLLEFLQAVSGSKTVTGQHCVPLVGSARLAGIQKVTGRYPGLFGQDFGFSEPGTWDGINFRQHIVDEAIRRYHEGFIITIMWHAVRPQDDEPVTFEESIQGKLTEAEWNELVTPGGRLNERWRAQVDVIAWHLKQLQHAGVPVLWRPYHEMNGGWFWWGKKRGDNGYKKLYRMLYDRLVRFHGIRNLLWVYNANELNENVDAYETYYPGDDVVDVLATDVYHQGFARRDYDQLMKLAGAKPIALGEVGAAPTPEILDQQPRWAWFMTWDDPSAGFKEGSVLRPVYESDRTLTLEELPWARIKSPKVHYPILK